jgi:hypothetical protein
LGLDVGLSDAWCDKGWRCLREGKVLHFDSCV